MLHKSYNIYTWYTYTCIYTFIIYSYTYTYKYKILYIVGHKLTSWADEWAVNINDDTAMVNFMVDVETWVDYWYNKSIRLTCCWCWIVFYDILLALLQLRCIVRWWMLIIIIIGRMLNCVISSIGEMLQESYQLLWLK